MYIYIRVRVCDMYVEIQAGYMGYLWIYNYIDFMIQPGARFRRSTEFWGNAFSEKLIYHDMYIYIYVSDISVSIISIIL